MGASIQPDPKTKATSKVEAMAGQGLRQRHAYSLLALGEVHDLQDENGKPYNGTGKEKFVILRNPWGFGEWTGDWSDTDQRRLNTNNKEMMLKSFREEELKGLQNQALKTTFDYVRYTPDDGNDEGDEDDDASEAHENSKIFKITKLSDWLEGTKSNPDFEEEEKAQGLKPGQILEQTNAVNWESVLAINKNDGTFMMTYDDFKNHYTHLFRCIKFPERWDGRRISGNWTQDTAGGNYKMQTWQQNPCYTLKVYEDTNFFFSLSGSDPRMEYGKDYNLHSHPFGFHICKYSTTTHGPLNPSFCYKKEKYDSVTKQMVQCNEPRSLTIPGSFENHGEINSDGTYNITSENNTDQAPYKFHHATSCWVSLRGPDMSKEVESVSRDRKKAEEQNANLFWNDSKGMPTLERPQYEGEEVGSEKKSLTISEAAEDPNNRPYAMYCIVPSMYQRTDKKTRLPVTGSFYLSAYGDAAAKERTPVDVPLEKVWAGKKFKNPDDVIASSTQDKEAIELVRKQISQKWFKKEDGKWYVPITSPPFELQGGSFIVEEAEAGSVVEKYTDMGETHSMSQKTAAHMTTIQEDPENKGDQNTPPKSEGKVKELEDESSKATTARAIQFEEGK
jgi:hypothetical protein